MKRWMIAIASMTVFGLALSLAAVAGEAEKAAKSDQPPLPDCPVMGEPIDFSISQATDAGPVFFCCARCLKKYNEDPEKFAGAVAAQRKALEKFEKVQVSCPVSGKPADPKVFTELDGKKVYFCCPGCKPQYEAEPAKFAAALANGYTYQTQCPVSGEPVDPASFVELAGGQKIYLCCPRCGEALFKDPAKHLPNLKKQGINLEPDQVKPKS